MRGRQRCINLPASVPSWRGIDVFHLLKHPLHVRNPSALSIDLGTWEKEGRGFSVLNCVHRLWHFPLRLHHELRRRVDLSLTLRLYRVAFCDDVLDDMQPIEKNRSYWGKFELNKPCNVEFRIRRDVPTAMQRRRTQYVTSNERLSYGNKLRNYNLP